jgi:hypothetical protein
MDLLQEKARREELTLEQIFNHVGEEGHAVLTLFLCLPFIQPIPIPGLSTPLGTLIIIVNYFLFRHQKPWLPAKFKHLKISSKLLLKVSESAEKIWSHTTRFLRPRWIFYHELFVFRTLSFLVCAVNGLLLALPLPIPFSNTIPVIAIFLNALGAIERDGLFTLLSYLWCFFVAAFFCALIFGVRLLL